MYPLLRLKPGREASAAFRHPWIFSGAIDMLPADLENGALVRVAGHNNEILGTGTFSCHSNIAVRILDFSSATIDKSWFSGRFRSADEHRISLGYGPGMSTTGYRLIFGESDRIPGLIVDRYEDVFVIQISTAGIDRQRSVIVEALGEVFNPRAIVERSDIAVRKEEGLEEVSQILQGESPGIVSFYEKGILFCADPVHGQKTGFYLDQKEMRCEIRAKAQGKSVLNLFSYTGASGIAAMKGGASSVMNVDSSREALALCEAQARLHNIDSRHFVTEETDAFKYLNSHDRNEFGMVILDPPALIKTRKDLSEGKKAYHFINRAAMRLVDDGGIFVTSSCSHFLSLEDFAFILRRASVQCGVWLEIFSIVFQSPDHPLSLYFPEGSYLKSFLCRVSRQPGRNRETGEKTRQLPRLTGMDDDFHRNNRNDE